MTARTLETLIRLSTAHAKARLANTVDEEDAQVAADILKFALFREVVEDEKVKRRRLRAEARRAAGAVSDDEEASDEDEVRSRSRSDSPLTPRRSQRSRQTRRQNLAEDLDVEDEDDDDLYGEQIPPSASLRSSRNRATQQSDSQQSFASSLPGLPSQSQPTQQNQSPVPITISSDRLELFTERMAEITESSLFEAGGATVESVLDAMNEGLDQEEKFSNEEGEKALEEMNEKNLIMVSGKIVYTV
jgi:DNA replication licensing factor MCM3